MSESTTEPTAVATDGAEDMMRPRYLLATLTAGAAAVHFAMAPIHAADDALHGIVFVIGAWAQLLAAGALLVRGDRRALVLSLAVNIGSMIVWGISRTIGLPLGSHAGHPEAITIVDATTTAMEVLAVVGAAALVARRGRIGTPLPTAATAVAYVAVMAITGGVLVHEDARGDAHGDHGSPEPMDHGDMDHGDMPGTTMDHGDMDHGDMPGTTMDHGSMDHDHGDMVTTTTAPLADDGHDHVHE